MRLLILSLILIWIIPIGAFLKKGKYSLALFEGIMAALISGLYLSKYYKEIMCEIININLNLFF